MGVAWSCLLVLFGVLLVVFLPQLLPVADSGGCENYPGSCAGTGDVVNAGLGVLVVGAWSMAVSVELLRGRRWARWAVAVTFSLWGIVALVGVVSVATSPEGPLQAGTLVWLVLLGYFTTTVVLAAGPADGW